MRSKIFLTLSFLPLFISLFFFPQRNFSEEKISKREVPVVGGTYRRPLEFNPKSFDPALSIDMYSTTVIQQIFDGLVQFDKNLNVTPAIAKSWKISPDGLTHTFYLREGVKFHNGREVTADDFVYSFTRIIDRKSNSPAAHLLEKVLGFNEFQDGKTTYVKGLRSLGKNIFKIFHGAPREKILIELKEGNLEESFIPPKEIEEIIKEKRYPFFQKPL